MVAGHLREQNGYYQMILSWKGKDGKRKGKSISTGLPVKGNKKRAEAMLLKTRKEFNPDNLMENADMLFTDFLSKWLKDKAVTLGTSTYAEYAYDVKNYIVPYFQEHPIALLKMTARDLENFYRHERQQNEATANELLLYHEVIVTAFQYAVDLEWIRENIMAQVNPCADEAPILFTDFLEEWLEMMKNSLEVTTYASYSMSIRRSIIPYCRRMVSRLMAFTRETSMPESWMSAGIRSTPSGWCRIPSPGRSGSSIRIRPIASDRVKGSLSGWGWPRLMVRLPCGSPSISSTFFPACANPIPRFAQVVVLPTPPFWLAMAMICVFNDFTSFLIGVVMCLHSSPGNDKSRHSKQVTASHKSNILLCLKSKGFEFLSAIHLSLMKHPL